MSYQILILIVPFVTSPYVSRVLGPDGVGTYSVTTSIVKCFSMFAAAGMANYGNRMISKARDGKENLSVTFCNLFYYQMINSSIYVALYIAYYFLIGESTYGLVSLCQVPYILSALFEVSWFFYGLENFKFIVTLNAIIKILTAICIFVFVKTPDDVWIYVLINASSLLAGQLCLWPFLLKRITWTAPKWSLIKSHFKPNMVLFVSVVAVSIFTIMDKIMIEWLSTTTEVGYYENSDKIFLLGCSIVGSIGAVMLPRMSYLVENEDKKSVSAFIDKSMKYILALSIAVCFGIMGISEQFCVIYFGQSFAKSGMVLSILSPAIVFYSWENILRTEYLLPNGRDNIFVAGTIVAAVVNAILNSLLIPPFGAAGAAAGTVCAQFAEALYQSVSVRKELPLLKYIRMNIPFLIIGIFMCVCCRMIGDAFGTSVKVLLCQIIIGAAVFSLLSALVFAKRKTSR